MKLTTRLATSQLKVNRQRTIWKLIGIILSVAMLTATYGFALGGRDLVLGISFEAHEIVSIEEFADYTQFTAEIVENFLYQSAHFTRIFISIAVILSIVIVGVSVVIVSNAFRISTTERLRQFGILKSVGATSRQIRQIVIYESLYLARIGIPIGLGLGLLVQAIGIRIANYFLTNIAVGYTTTLRFSLSWQILLAAVLVSLLMVVLAAWLPARRAAKIPAIDAIRGAGEVKIKAKRLRRGQFVGRLLGYEATLAAKSEQRNRRNLRATVTALTISIVLFISAAGFGHTINRTAHIIFDNITDHTVAAAFIANWQDKDTFLESQRADEITAQLHAFGDVSLIGVGYDSSFYRTYLPSQMITPAMRDFLHDSWHAETGLDYYRLDVRLITADPKTYRELAIRAGVPEGSNILINHFTIMLMQFDETGITDRRWFDLVPYLFTPQTIEIASQESSFELEIHGALGRDDLPSEIWDIANNALLSIIVPDLRADTYFWYATPAYNIDGFVTHVEKVLHQTIDTPKVADIAEPQVRLQVINIEQEAGIVANTARLVMIFVYGFVALLIVVGLTNIISTVTTNIHARSREFAMLKSVGMDARGLRRMLNFESIFCSAKALIIGLPLGLLAAWLIHGTLTDRIDFPFTFPWLALLQCVIGVFILTWSVMRASARKLQRQNIIETIRADS